MIDVVEILQHWHAGRPKAVIADSLRVDRRTVRKYVAPAEQAGLVPGGPRLCRAEWEVLVRGWFPELTDAKARSATRPLIEPFRERIEAMLATNTATTVHQRLRDEQGLVVGLTSFRRYCWTEFPERTERGRVRVPRPPVDPGEEAQIDYGLLGCRLDPVANRVRRVWAFVMVLVCSRHMFVRPVLRLDQAAWVAAHVAAFDFFGGCPRRSCRPRPARAIGGVDAAGNLNASLAIDKPRVDQMLGFWDEAGKKITFIRVINATDPSTNQVYTGFYFNNERDQPTDVSHTITGFFEAFQGTGGVAERVLYGWVAGITVVG